MRSQLTRTVFRRLLSNEGLTFSCPTQLASQFRPRPRHGSAHIFRRPQSRTLWGLDLKAPRKPKEPQLVPGFEKMLEFSKLMKMGARPPPVNELVLAWRRYFQFQNGRNKASNRLQAIHVMRLLEYLRALRTDDGNYVLSTDDLETCKKNMDLLPANGVDKHVEIVRVIYDVVLKRNPTDAVLQNIYRRFLIQTLARGGEAAAARELLGNNTEPNYLHLWRQVMIGFAMENNGPELVQTFEKLEDMGIFISPKRQEVLINFFASRNDVGATKKWYNHRHRADPDNASGPLRPTADALTTLLKFSIRKNELEWCKSIFRRVLEKEPSKEEWDVVFQWAAGAVGKGVEDVERFIGVMIQRNPNNEKRRPDIVTINGLVEMAISIGDPYLAERYITLGRKFGIRPDAKTFILQMDYRIDAGDLTGAQAAYNSLQSEEILDGEDLPAINRFIRVLCRNSGTYDKVFSLLSDLEARKVGLEAETTSAVVMMYMELDQEQDVFDILNSNAYHYTVEERTRLLGTFVAFCLDRRNSEARAWSSYQVIVGIFSEAPTDVRTTLMNEFFDRGRSDMACYVFGHMRQHSLSVSKPTLETYIACFEGIAKCEDSESLEMVHNMFKMDSAMDPSTKLLNSLMLAYTSIEDGDRALEFWDDITNSDEGPSYRSLEIVFRACQLAPFGDKQAREIWSSMRRMDIEITRDVFQSYVGALAGKGKMDEAKEMIESGEKEFGIKPDFMTFGIFYNAMPGQNRKDMIEDWGKGMFPEAWSELEKVGQKTTDGGFVKLFNIKRDYKA